MRRGAWHQCGDKSQNLVSEHLGNGIGVGVILSPKDLAARLAVQRAAEYRSLGADVLLDQQFYNPGYSNSNLQSYETTSFRQSITLLNDINDQSLAELTTALEKANRDIAANAVLAPSVVYQAASSQIIDLNARLFEAAKNAGNSIGVPTYATVVLGSSLVGNGPALANVLSSITALDCDGWYFGFEFGPERIPSDANVVRRCIDAGLTLASTGKPILHAYSGPTCLLSFGFGATGVGIGHHQTLWKFNSGHWQGSTAQGGGGNAPARFFSTRLWGTIICPDEFSQLPSAVRQLILTTSPYSTMVEANAASAWPRWEAGKHLVHVLGETIASISQMPNARTCMNNAVSTLNTANSTYSQVLEYVPTLKDAANSYHLPWITACEASLDQRADDYDYLELIASV